jgi:hypothetical protein
MGVSPRKHARCRDVKVCLERAVKDKSKAISVSSFIYSFGLLPEIQCEPFLINILLIISMTKPYSFPFTEMERVNRVTGHRVSNFVRVGSGHGSVKEMTRPGMLGQYAESGCQCYVTDIIFQYYYSTSLILM